MAELIALVLGGFGGVLLALLALLALWLGLRLSGRVTQHGLMPWFFPSQLLAAAISMAFTGRSFDAPGLSVAGAVTASWAGEWSIRIASLIALIGSIDALLRWIRSGERVFSLRLSVMLAFVLLWLTQILSPALWGRYPEVQTFWAYSLVVGLGLLALSAQAAEQTLIRFRDAQALFCVASLLLAVFWPNLVLQRDYEQGFIDGLPRLAGLAPHAVSMAGLAATLLIVLLYRPYQRPWLQHLVLLITVAVIVLTQSKTVWALLAVALPLVLAFQGRLPTWRALANSPHRSWAALGYAVAGTGGLAILAWSVSGEAGYKLGSFIASDEGAQLMSLTGRDRIWALAFEEWRQSPVFGYGISLFDAAHRAALRFGAATHAHNQYVDSLARSGLVGLAGAVVYVLALLAAAWRVARRTQGLSMGLLIILLAYSVTEVPLSLTSLGTANFYHWVLLAVLGGALATPVAVPVPSHSREQVRAC
ncbi:MAG: O-antigen ligase family protein [Ideonella sp.]|nr:O-antigen ligase family protein [Ideonella sp.]